MHFIGNTTNAEELFNASTIKTGKFGTIDLNPHPQFHRFGTFYLFNKDSTFYIENHNLTRLATWVKFVLNCFYIGGNIVYFSVNCVQFADMGRLSVLYVGYLSVDIIDFSVDITGLVVGITGMTVDIICSLGYVLHLTD